MSGVDGLGIMGVSPVVSTAMPAIPPRNAVVPVMPIVVKAPPSLSPITGAKRPAGQ